MSSKRALVVIDVQNEYFTGSLPIQYPPVAQTLPNIGRAMDAARAAGVPVVVVQHSSPADAPAFAEGSRTWALHEEVASRPRDHYIEKRMPSVFVGTGFAEWLAERGIDTLAVCGYMTQHCDASTTYHAYHAGLAVEFLSDATGSPSYENAAGRAGAEEIHRVMTVVYQSGFAAVATTDAWIAALRSGEELRRDDPVTSSQRALARRDAA